METCSPSALSCWPRQGRPEKCLDIVELRAPHGFIDLDAVIIHQELEEIAQSYKCTAQHESVRGEIGMRSVSLDFVTTNSSDATPTAGIVDRPLGNIQELAADITAPGVRR